jgi:phage virion morphogenesis protein
MAGASFTIRGEWQDDQVRRAIAAWRRLGQRPEPLLRAIGVKLVSNTQDRFDAAQAPDGAPWAGLSPAYAPLKRGPGILRESGMRGGLQGSITMDVRGDELAVGSNKIYAAVHQFGATITAKNAPALVFRVAGGFARVRSVRIPARPYLGLSRADEDAVLDATEAAVLAAGR